MSICCSFHCTPEISTKAGVLRFNPVIFEIVYDSRIISPWMGFRLLEIVCVILVILTESSHYGNLQLWAQSYPLTSLWTPDSIPCVHKLASNDSQSSNPLPCIKCSDQHFNLLVASHYSVTWSLILELMWRRCPVVYGHGIGVVVCGTFTHFVYVVFGGFAWRWNSIVRYWRSW